MITAVVFAINAFVASLNFASFSSTHSQGSMFWACMGTFAALFCLALMAKEDA